jgi:hypothetical protein
MLAIDLSDFVHDICYSDLHGRFYVSSLGGPLDISMQSSSLSEEADI